MLRLTDARHFRRTLVGTSLLLAPLAGLVAVLLMPQTDSDSTGALLATVAANKVRWELSAWVLMLAAFLIVPVAVGSIHLMTAEDVAIGHIGGGLAIAGAFALCATAGLDLALAEAAGAAGGGAAVGDGVAQLARLLGWISVAAVGAATALVVGGLHRVGVMPLAGAVCAVAGGLVFIVAPDKLLEAAGIAVLGAGLAMAGLAVLSMSDAEWWAVLDDPGS